MMKDIQLLDCTVRDGGYINDWYFGQNRLISIFERLVRSGVDIIEIGFLDDRRPFDINRSIGPDTESLKKVWGNITKRPPMVVGMIDYGTCAADRIEPEKESFIDGIRVIFKKQKMHEAMAFCQQMKDMGYKVFSQLVSITSYNDDELSELIELVNQVKPYAVSMVDTYGLLLPPRLLHYSDLLDKYVDEEVRLGFHAHNNFQMGFANASCFLERKTDRSILVDGTLFGMGKSAGNAPLELLAMHLNNNYGKSYNIQPMLEAIEESIIPIYKEKPWGYQQFFYMTAKQSCHPNYLTFFQKKQNLSLSDLDNLLETIPFESRLMYDEEVAESLYEQYLAKTYDDDSEIKRISSALEGKTILIVGPGKNIRLQYDRVEKFISDSEPVVISINYIPERINIDFLFLTKRNRYEEMTVRLHTLPDVSVIATSNVTPQNSKFEYVVTRKPLLEEKSRFEDNSFLMLLRLLKKAGIRKVFCAGLDGYSVNEDNYTDASMEYDFVKASAVFLNHHIQDSLSHEFGDMTVDFITYSHYCDRIDMESAAY